MHDPPTANGLVNLVAREHEHGTLVDLLRQLQASEQRVDVLSARVELLLETLLALLPAHRVHRRFDVQQASRNWVEADEVQFTLIAALLPLTDQHVAAQKVPLVFVPFREQLL